MKIIPEKCKKCLSCVDVCPMNAISKRDDFVIIDSEKCLDCGCCKSTCPYDAIEFE